MYDMTRDDTEPRRSTIKRWIGAIVGLSTLVMSSMGANADDASAPELAPPPGATVVREVQAGGVQVYACRAMADGSFVWTLVGPKAILVNSDGTDFGVHAAGPTWTATDGSSIVADGAHPLAKGDRPNSVPALVLAVKSRAGHGILDAVRFVRRSDTEGGVPPATGCDATHTDAAIARHYSAIYTFYK